MGNQKTSGLTKRGGIWHIDKQFRGVRIRESAATSDLTEAVALLSKRIEAIRKALIYGVRPERTFRAAATKYLQENQHKRSISDDARHLALLDPFIGDLFHLLRMASYKVNAGNREEEVCSLKWAWERKVPELETSVFVIPGDRVKNAEDRLVVLNRIARSAVEAARGMHPEYVFVRQEKDGRSIPIKKMYGTAWKNARERAADAWERAHGTAAPKGFRRVRVHDLKHVRAPAASGGCVV
jgi:hypothetical protein